MYFLFDANTIASYYLPRAATSKKQVNNLRILINSVRTKKSEHFFYIPNFCIAEIFNVFYKYHFSFNKRIEKLNKLSFQKIRKQFEIDIHNGKLFYQYELSRYHILTINTIAPIQHHYKLSRNECRPGRLNASTYDLMIIGMGIHLVKIHGKNNVYIVTSDARINKIIKKCNTIKLSDNLKNTLDIYFSEKFTGVNFNSENFPNCIDPSTDSNKKFEKIFGAWPLSVGKTKEVSRLLKT